MSTARSDPRNINLPLPSDRGVSLGVTMTAVDGAVAVDDRMVPHLLDAQLHRDREAHSDQRDRDRTRRRHPQHRARDPLRRLAHHAAAAAAAIATEQHHDDTADRPQDSGGGDRPARQRRGHQTQVEVDLATVHGAHTWTRARSFSSRAGPMPSTSPSWSTLVNEPLASRHATIAAAVTGPTPGSASSCSSGRGVQVDRTAWRRGTSGGRRFARGSVTSARMPPNCPASSAPPAARRCRRRSAHRRRRGGPCSAR